tara:strand:- start:248 stop:493 length:246 start_codon:yes stop_codon:yes gene_type:complete
MDQSVQNDDLVVEPRKIRYIWLVYLLLYALAIPWYWPEGYRGPLILGFPLWVAVSLGAVLLLAVWTVWVIRRYWIMAQEEE